MRSGARANDWLGMGLRWMLATGAGFAAGIGVWQAIYGGIRRALVGPVGAVGGILLFGALLGACVGLAQARARGGSGATGGGHVGVWTLASAVGFAIGLLVATAVSGLMAQQLSGRVIVYVSDGSEDLTFGLLLGGIAGLVRWVALRRQAAGLGVRTILASAVAVAVGWSATLGIFDVLPGVTQPWLGAAFGACAGALVGLVEWLSHAAIAP